MSAKRYYYLDAFMDEIMPCTPTLEGWAQWLSLPPEHVDVKDWGRADIVPDGTVFIASTLDLQADVVVTKTEEGWSHDSAEGDLFAVRFGSGLGWDAERSGDSLEQLLECETEYGDHEVGDEVIIAVCKNGPDLHLEFCLTPGGPELKVVGQIQ